MTTALRNPLRADPSEVWELTIALEQGDTDLPDCQTLPQREYGAGYYADQSEPLSIAQLPDSGDEYVQGCSKVAGYNARACARRGYHYERIDRADWKHDLYALRKSSLVRQGRAMPAAYRRFEDYPSDAWPDAHCPRHAVTVHGVVSYDDHLRAYAQVVQCGEVVRVNTILGHAAALRHGVMWLLVVELVRWHIDTCGARFALYYAHDSGHGPGLRYFKERLGFRPAIVDWMFE